MANDIDFNDRSTVLQGGSPENKKNFGRKWPRPLSQDAFHGVAGEIVKLVEPNTEADPVAVLVQLLVGIGNMVGRSPYFLVGSTKHHTNLYAVLVGESSMGRKGTAFEVMAEILKEVDLHWWDSCRVFGLGSGEALVSSLTPSNPNRDFTRYGGPHDKRAFVTEGEYAAILKVSSREGNTLSTNLRKSFDSGEMSSLTKNVQLKVQDAHVSMVAHITKDELLRFYRASTDIFNGVANRNIWIASKRSKLVPFPEAIDQNLVIEYSERLQEAVLFGKNIQRMNMSPQTKKEYEVLYRHLSKEQFGLLAVLYARAAPIIIRLSCIYALLDKSAIILPEHLRAAKAIWDYSEASIQYIFGDSTGSKHADMILEALKLEPQGLSRTEISEKVFNRNQNKYKIDAAIELLSSRGLIKNGKRFSDKIDRQIGIYTATNDEFYESAKFLNSLNS